MSHKVELRKVNSVKSPAFGKYFWHTVYEDHFVETDELADFIQQQASIKRSDIKATLDELGAAMKHFFELGQKVRLDGIGIFKVGISSKGVTDPKKATVNDITTRRILFQPETEQVKVTLTTGTASARVKTLTRNIAFEESRDYTSDRKAKDEDDGNENGGD